MEMSQIQQLNSIMNPKQNQATIQKTPHEAQQTFKSWLNQSINKVNQAQVQSEVITDRMARGENVDLHDVMITAQKASLTLQTTMEVRNKAIEAYQEIMRMQV